MKPTFLLLAVLIGFVGIQASLAQAVVQFTTTSYTVAENAGAVTLSVQRTGDTSMRTSVDYLSADGTATHGVKYTAVTGGAISQVGGLEDGVRDFVVVLDELTKWNETDARFVGRVRLDQIAAIGFSWGSPTIGRLAQQEPRCKAVVLLDGGGYESLQGFSKPSLTMHAPDNSDQGVFAASKTNAVWFQLSNTDHASFVNYVVFGTVPLATNSKDFPHFINFRRK